MFLLSAAALAALAGTAQAQDKPAAEAPEKLPSISDKTRGAQKIDGYMPLYWAARPASCSWRSALRQELLYQVSCRPASARTRSGSIAASSATPQSSRSSASARRSDDAAELQYRAITSDAGGAARGRGVVRAVGPLGLQGRGRRGRPRARRRDRVLPARRPRRRRAAAAGEAGELSPRRRRAARSTCRAQGLSRRTPRSKRC